jgi:hypothetical protein
MASRKIEFFATTVRPTWLHRQLAFAGLVFLLVVFSATAPFASLQLPRLNSFVPTAAAIIFVTNLTTAVLLFCQFSSVGSRALIVLGSGYLFSALIVIPWALTFPGAFAPGGLMGAGIQSAPWLYTFWNFGFSASVVAYASLKDDKHADRSAKPATRSAIYWSLAIITGLVCALTWGVTVGGEFTPHLFFDDISLSPLAHYDTGIILSMCALGLILLWTRRTSILDLWLLIAVCALTVELVIVTWLITSRFSLGFYLGGGLSVFASMTVLVALLSQITTANKRLACAYGAALERERECTTMNLEAVVADFADQVRQPLTAIAAQGAAARRFLEGAPPNIERVKGIVDEVVRASFRADDILRNFGATVARRQPPPGD